MINNSEFDAILHDVRGGDEASICAWADAVGDRDEEVLAAAVRALPALLASLYDARQALLEEGPRDPKAAPFTLVLELNGDRWAWKKNYARGQAPDTPLRSGRHPALAVLFAEWDAARSGIEFLLRRLNGGEGATRFSLALRPLRPAYRSFGLSSEAALELREDNHLPALRDALLFRLARLAVRERAVGGPSTHRPLALTDDPGEYQIVALFADFGPPEPVAPITKKE
jgi:hypothetical protein